MRKNVIKAGGACAVFGEFGDWSGLKMVFYPHCAGFFYAYVAYKVIKWGLDGVKKDCLILNFRLLVFFLTQDPLFLFIFRA